MELEELGSYVDGLFFFLKRIVLLVIPCGSSDANTPPSLANLIQIHNIIIILNILNGWIHTYTILKSFFFFFNKDTNSSLLLSPFHQTLCKDLHICSDLPFVPAIDLKCITNNMVMLKWLCLCSNIHFDIIRGKLLVLL